ncbi:hypothetical protein, conserved [Babesia bigemina]|uniref:Uncharacterized protein n=1 Tax=Babesia bigemina TaxID=5866 RepID=A0A061BS23_BABBI|nr:hypothetical protein, conserved [Babesia bigemina]CDR71366.1 hypothetical protein, conserved [Babesia bigemina]|eukprot:XP_012770316.1 hypothetical protein, conserved [Babesia bigemina]
MAPIRLFGAQMGDGQCALLRLRGLGAAVVEGSGRRRGRWTAIAVLDVHFLRSKKQGMPSVGRRTDTQQPTANSPNVLPIIIAAVALVIIVVCVMIYFRIRPFHRVRDLPFCIAFYN